MSARTHPATRPCVFVLLWHTMCCVAERESDLDLDRPYELNVFVATANNAGKEVTGKLFDDLLSSKSSETDIVIVGFQEDKSVEIPDDDSLALWEEYKVDYSNTFCTNGRQSLRVYAKTLTNKCTYEEEDITLEGATKAENGVFIDTNQYRYGVVPAECGKGFAIIKLKFTSLDKKRALNVCAMVTHMSAKGTAEHRAKQLDNSYHITTKAGCDFTVFAGDFNSRLHCRVPQDDWKVPVYSRCTPSKDGEFSSECIKWNKERTESKMKSTDSSMQYILAEFCTKNGGGQTRCSLRQGNKEQADELVQLLNNQFVECFEGKDAKDAFENEADWKLENFVNPHFELTFKSEGWQELDVPDFTPTYKVTGCSENDVGAWKSKITDKNKCWHNEDRKGKHNPAWTDRILIAGKKHIQWRQGGYKAIQSTHSVADHLPVVGKVVLDVGQSSSM